MDLKSFVAITIICVILAGFSFVCGMGFAFSMTAIERAEAGASIKINGMYYPLGSGDNERN